MALTITASCGRASAIGFSITSETSPLSRHQRLLGTPPWKGTLWPRIRFTIISRHGPSLDMRDMEAFAHEVEVKCGRIKGILKCIMTSGTTRYAYASSAVIQLVALP